MHGPLSDALAHAFAAAGSFATEQDESASQAEALARAQREQEQARAQAQREAGERERLRLEAALRIQRSVRGHAARGEARARRAGMRAGLGRVVTRALNAQAMSKRLGDSWGWGGSPAPVPKVVAEQPPAASAGLVARATLHEMCAEIAAELGLDAASLPKVQVCTRITTCYAYRVETGPCFVPG